MESRDLYRTLEVPGLNPLRHLRDSLDEASGMKPTADVLAFLRELNHQIAAAEKAGRAVVGPGLPACATNPPDLITPDCVQPPVLR